jgi:hypothetical protein
MTKYVYMITKIFETQPRKVYHKNRETHTDIHNDIIPNGNITTNSNFIQISKFT